jgi:hypothetical protein
VRRATEKSERCDAELTTSNKFAPRLICMPCPHEIFSLDVHSLEVEDRQQSTAR